MFLRIVSLECMMEFLSFAPTRAPSIFHEAWNGQTYDDFPSKIRWIKLADGSWEYDYTIFDRWIEFMTDEIGMENARIHCYSTLPWGLTFHYYDEVRQRDVDVRLQPVSEEYDEFWGSFLRDFKTHLRARGFDGFLRWAYQSWVENPLVSTDYMRWPSGDCFLVYPGDRSSVRFERLRDGIENFEKIRLLREWHEQAPSSEGAEAIAELDRALSVFKWDGDQQKRLHRMQVERVNDAILDAARIVPDT